MKSIKNILPALSLFGHATVTAQPTSVTEPVSIPAPLFASPDEAARAVGVGAVLLDARPWHAFALGHPTGAVRVAWDDFSDRRSRGRLDPDAARLGRLLGALGVDGVGPVYVIGAWDGLWGEEARVAWMLRRLGVADVRVVEGGWDAWIDAELPVSRGVASNTARTFAPPRADPSVEATLESLGDADLVLDVRTRAEFDGATPHGSARGGHVPGAVHVEWTAFFDGAGRLLPPEEVRRIVGAPTDARVVAYCTGGVRSAFVWAVLRYAGYDHAANYAGSWWEYAATDLPVER